MAQKVIANPVNFVTSDGKVINKMIASIANRTGKLETDINVAAASCIIHAIKHGNATMATSLVNAMTSKFRVNELRSWFESNGPLVWKSADKKNDKPAQFIMASDGIRKEYTDRIDTDEKYGQFVLDLLQSPWGSKPEPEFKGFDFDAKLAKLLKEAVKFSAKAKDFDEKKKKQVKMGHLDKAIAFAAANGISLQ